MRDAVIGFTNGGVLNNNNDTGNKVSNIEIPGGVNPEGTAEQVFEKIITEAGFKPDQIYSDTSTTGGRRRRVVMEDGTIILFRTESGKNEPTNQVQIKSPVEGKKRPDIVIDFKIRYTNE